MSSTKEKKRDARKKRSAAAARGDEDAKKKMKNDADRKKELRRIRAECAKPDWPGFPDRDASLGPALTDKEKAAQQAARDSIAKEKARKKKRVRTNEHSERHKERLRALISEALLEVQREFIKILEKQDMCRVDGVLASEPERRLELSRDPDLAFGCYLPEDLALPQIGADLAWLHVLEIVLQTNLTPWSYDCDGGPRRKRRVFDLRELQSIPIRSIAYDREGRIDPKLLLPKPWAGYKLDATRPLTELGKTEILHSRAPRCPEHQADGRARELLRAFREKALYLCDGRRAVSWRCHECWLRRDRDQVNNMEAHACPYESCGAPRDRVKNEFLPETPKAPRPRAYIDLSIGNKPTGRIVFELFDDKAPKTVELFLKHCKGKFAKPVYYDCDIIKTRYPFPDTDQYQWNSLDDDDDDDDDTSPRGWSFGYDISRTDFPTIWGSFQEEEPDELKFTIYEPFIREGTLYFRYRRHTADGPAGFYILMGTRPLNAGAFGRDVPIGRVLNYDASGFEAEPDPPKGMKNSGDTMSEIEHHWADFYDLETRIRRRGADPSDSCATEAEAAQLLQYTACRDVTEALRRRGADWTRYCGPNVNIIACGRLEDADNSISRMAYLAALHQCASIVYGTYDYLYPAYKFLEPYGDDWERALAAVAGRSEAWASRVAKLSPDDYSSLFHALDTELRLEREAAQRLEDADHSDVEDDDVVEGPRVEQDYDDYVEEPCVEPDLLYCHFCPDDYIDHI